MLFNTGIFILFFMLFLIIYSFVHHKRLTNLLLVIFFSLFFYYKISGWHFIFILIPLFSNFYFAKAIHKSRKDRQEKLLWFSLALAINLGMLGYFKYTGFFTEVFNCISGSTYSILKIIMPVGISYYIFRSISYIVDVYREDIKPETDLASFSFYITFFPLLFSGPISRASDFLPQLKKNLVINKVQVNIALYFIIQGLIKKAIIADYLGQYNDLVFASPGNYTGFENLMAIYGNAAQIYFDFSGYTDMAIGLAALIGIDIGINFNKPYHALNLTDFWRRWHISLSTWLRDYIFMPLTLKFRNGGKVAIILILVITFLICGFWHNSNISFIIWGILNGLIMGFEIITSGFRKQIKKKMNIRVYNTLSWLITFHLIVALWVIFRAPTLHDAQMMASQVFCSMDWTYVLPFFNVRSLFVIVLFAGIALYSIPVSWFPAISKRFINIPFWAKAIIFIIVLQCVVQLQSESMQIFLYAEF